MHARSRLPSAASSYQCISWRLLPRGPGAPRARAGQREDTPFFSPIARAVVRKPHGPWYQLLPSMSRHLLRRQVSSSRAPRTRGGRAPTYPRRPAPDWWAAYLAKGGHLHSSRTCGPEYPREATHSSTARAPAGVARAPRVVKLGDATGPSRLPPSPRIRPLGDEAVWRGRRRAVLRQPQPG